MYRSDIPVVPSVDKILYDSLVRSLVCRKTILCSYTFIMQFMKLINKVKLNDWLVGSFW